MRRRMRISHILKSCGVAKDELNMKERKEEKKNRIDKSNKTNDKKDDILNRRRGIRRRRRGEIPAHKNELEDNRK